MILGLSRCSKREGCEARETGESPWGRGSQTAVNAPFLKGVELNEFYSKIRIEVRTESLRLVRVG